MSDLPAGVEAKGGGYYLLPDGSTVRGKEAAIAAAEELARALEEEIAVPSALPGKPHAKGPAAQALARVRARRRN